MKHAYRWTALLALSLLSACGGSSHSSPPAPMAFTIGGSITGLTASGLVLLDNGGDTLDVAANTTSFKFDQSVTAGGAYNVSAQTQPAGETCTVTSGSGTANANVTSVVVSCTANTPPVTYTIGGTIEGLTAAGLVLQDNGGDNYSATAGTAFPFTFATALTSGATYAVTVQTQPTGETCVVSDGSGTASANVTTVIVSCSQYAANLGTNVVSVTVGNGPTAATNPTFNIPYVTVKVCEPSSPTTCAIINNVEVDTGSVGLRLLASALASPDGGSPVTLPSFADPGTPANTISECWHFGGSSDAWGAVATADVGIGGESGSNVEVQVINDGTPAPNNCSGTQFGAVTDFDANGILGVGVMQQDCGTGCETPVAGDFYYTCTSASSSSCTQVGLTTTAQVPNPVLSFADNNGVILQLPAVPATGLATANGYLVFGIGTAAGDNSLGGATVLTADASGEITTTLSDGTAADGLFDTGTNYLAFSDSSDTSLLTCLSTPLDNASFYCPASTLSLSANNVGANSATLPASFQIANLYDLSQTSSSSFALNNVGGPDSSLFDWGLPFFYGNTVFVAIDGQMAGGTTGPYYAY